MNEFIAAMDVTSAENLVLAKFLHEWDANPSLFIDGAPTMALRLVLDEVAS